MDTPTTPDRATSYSSNSNGIFQSEVIFEKRKVKKLKNDLLDNLRAEIKKHHQKRTRISSCQFDMSHNKLHY